MSGTIYFPNLRADGDRPVATGTKKTVSGEDKSCLDVIIQNDSLAPVTVGPVSFTRNGVSVEVTEDTVTPANNIPLPVKLSSVTGDINITAGDLNVHSTHAGVNYDSIRIGDGTDLLAVNGDGSINVVGSFSEQAVAADGAAAPAVAKVIGGVDGSGNTQFISVDTAGELQADIKSIEGIIDAGNSTTTPLAGGASFVGTWRDVKDYNSINLGVFSDQASATDGLRIEYSSDGVTVHHYHLWTFPGGANGIGYQLAVEFRYFRVNYTNGATPQTTFVIQSNLKSTSLFPSSYRASTTFTANSQVILTKGVIVGETTGGGGGYVAVKVNPSGALTTETSITGSLPAGTNNIGDVDVLSLPSLPAGTNNIGDVDVLSLPSLPAGSNAIGTVGVTSLPSIPAGSNAIGTVGVTALPSIPAGANNIGSVNVAEVIPGTSATNLGKAEDAVHASGDVGVMALAVRNDAGTAFASDGDYVPFSVNASGELRVAASANVATFDIVDFLDTPLLDASSTNIPASASTPLTVVASLAANVKKIQVLDTTGSFIGVYSNPAVSPVLEAIIGPGSDSTIEVTIPAGTVIGLRNMENSAITVGNVAINFFG